MEKNSYLPQKIIALLLTGIMSVSLLVGCKDDNTSSTPLNSSEQYSSSTEATSTTYNSTTNAKTTAPTSSTTILTSTADTNNKDNDSSSNPTINTNKPSNSGNSGNSGDSSNIVKPSTTTKKTTTAAKTTKKPTTTTIKTDYKNPQNVATLKPDGEKPSKTTIRNKTTAQIVRNMGIGINLGNTFEATSNQAKTVTEFEQAWGSPVITKAMIKGIANEGFGVVRIPVAWSNMMDTGYNISSDYINRIKEVTDWAIDSGLYVIINLHWDGGWITQFPSNETESTKKYTAIWTQISSAFKNYGDAVMFESMNEEGDWQDLWNRYGGSNTVKDGKKKAYALFNKINQKFVDIVRASGGNNAKRHLLIAGYVTDIDLTVDSLFKMPTDPAKRMALSIHYYNPSSFTIIENDESWAKARATWGTDADYKELEKYMTKLKTTFVDKGIPVIIGEMGVANTAFKTNGVRKSRDQLTNYNLAVMRSAYYKGMCPILWDTPDARSYYNRYSYTIRDKDLKQGIQQILKS